MKTNFRQLAGHVVAVLLVAGVARAQSGDSLGAESATAVSRAPGNGLLISVIGGQGASTPTEFVNPNGDSVYSTTKRPVVFELELTKTMARSGGSNFFWEYFVASQPAIALGGNLRYDLNGACINPRFCHVTSVNERYYTSYGFGVTPLGLRILGVLPGNLKLGASLSAGAVYLTKAVPYDLATHFNFQLMARPTLGIPVGRLGTVWSGYEFFHVSNGGIGRVNPGINAGLFVLGFQAG